MASSRSWPIHFGCFGDSLWTDVGFQPMPYEPIEPSDGDMIVALSTNSDFSKALNDDDFAAVAFVDLSYHDWAHHAGETGPTSRGAVSNLIASLRARGETYLHIDMEMNDRIFTIPKTRLVSLRQQLSDILQPLGWSRL